MRLSNKRIGLIENADIYFEQARRQSLAKIQVKDKTLRELELKEKRKEEAIRKWSI